MVLHHLKKKKGMKLSWIKGKKKKNTLLFHARCQAFLDSALRNRKRHKAFSLFAAYVRRIHRKLITCVVTLPQVGQNLKIHTIGINTTMAFLLQKPYLFAGGIHRHEINCLIEMIVIERGVYGFLFYFIYLFK